MFLCVLQCYIGAAEAKEQTVAQLGEEWQGNTILSHLLHIIGCVCVLKNVEVLEVSKKS
jgi:hypothetical protein